MSSFIAVLLIIWITGFVLWHWISWGIAINEWDALNVWEPGKYTVVWTWHGYTVKERKPKG